MVKKILVLFLFFLSPVLSGAAGSAAISSNGSLERMAPYIDLVMHASDYLNKQEYFNGSDRERDELLVHAQTICALDEGRLFLFSHCLHGIYKKKAPFDVVLKSIRQHPQFDEDRITITKRYASKYLAAGSIADAIHRLAVDVHGPIVEKMLQAEVQEPLKADIDIPEPIDVTLVRLIRLEKKGIKIAIASPNNVHIQAALRQAAARGVMLDIIVDADVRHSLHTTGLPFKEIGGINASGLMRRYILFEQNINNEPILTFDAYYVQPNSKIKIANSYVTRNKSTYDDYSTYFNQLKKLTSPDLVPMMSVGLEEQNVQKPSIGVSSEARLLFNVLEAIWWDHFCTPVKDESFEDACKRQRRW